MTKLKIVNQLSYKRLPRNYEKTRGLSKTVQGEAYTIAELMQRSAGHIIDSITRDGHYDPDADYDSIDMEKANRSDIIDKQDLINQEIRKDIERKAKQKQSEKTAQQNNEGKEPNTEPEGTKEPVKVPEPNVKVEQEISRSTSK